ncbi:DUF1064 domain-containing protein [Rummeliibacillus sp. JY-2-4R]
MKRKNKYNNRKVEVDGIVFDSYMESRYYRDLKEWQHQGIVKTFEMQVPFILQDAFTKDGKRHKAIKYIADFVVTFADGRTEVIDVKGKITQTFRNKQKLFEFRYPDKTIKCVTRKHKEWIEL